MPSETISWGSRVQSQIVPEFVGRAVFFETETVHLFDYDVWGDYTYRVAHVVIEGGASKGQVLKMGVDRLKLAPLH